MKILFHAGFVAFVVLQQRFCCAKPAPIPQDKEAFARESYGNEYGTKSAENFSVWYVSDSGKLEQLSTWYSGKKVNWDVSHFSDFIIAYNANTVVKENPNTGAF